MFYKNTYLLTRWLPNVCQQPTERRRYWWVKKRKKILLVTHFLLVLMPTRSSGLLRSGRKESWCSACPWILHHKSWGGFWNGTIRAGTSSDEHEIQHGLTCRHNSYLRHLLVEAAWIAIRKDPNLLRTFTTLTRRMNNKKAIIRIAKTLLNRIRYVWKHQTAYLMKPVASKGWIGWLTAWNEVFIREDGPFRASCMLIVWHAFLRLRPSIHDLW